MQEVYSQLFCLLIFIINGIAIGILFDIFRILRRSFNTTDWITYFQDILFWILAGCIMLFSIFTFNNGEIRSYVFIGIILGGIFYMLTISRFFVKLSVDIIELFKKILYYPMQLIKSIIKTLIIKPLLFFGKKGKNSIRNTKQKIYNLTKFDRKQYKSSKKIKEKEGIL